MKSDRIEELIRMLELMPHPEGGYYRETYRSQDLMTPTWTSDQRNVSTGIYFLLTSGNFSAFHRIKSDEMWHFYEGGSMTVYVIDPRGKQTEIVLGRDLSSGECLQAVVPANHWFASRVNDHTAFSLVGCTVAPGFDFHDFHLAIREELIAEFPQHEHLITSLTR
nr:cupin domain-containing protein [Fulvivirga sedimenti]